jgi:hypothetical protein
MQIIYDDLNPSVSSGKAEINIVETAGYVVPDTDGVDLGFAFPDGNVCAADHLSSGCLSDILRQSRNDPQQCTHDEACRLSRLAKWATHGRGHLGVPLRHRKWPVS